jgi:hypothetical protein
MAFSGMLRRVALVRTDVSEELSVSIIMTTIGELGTTFAVTSNRRMLRRFTKVFLMKEALISSETSVLTRATRRNILEDTFFIYNCLLFNDAVSSLDYVTSNVERSKECGLLGETEENH